MVTETYNATLLTEESEYELTEELAESFNGFDITTGPKIGENNNIVESKIEDVVGIVEDCWYEDGEGIIAEIIIYDSQIIEEMNAGEIFACPSIIRNLEDSEAVEGMEVFLTHHPGEEVGDVEQV